MVKCVCLNTCKSSALIFRQGEVYYYKPLINFKNELKEYIIYASKDDTYDMYLGYVKIEFKEKNFMDYGSYVLDLEDVDLLFEEILFGLVVCI